MSLSTMNWKRGLLRLWAVAAVFLSLSTISVVAASNRFEVFVPKPNQKNCQIHELFKNFGPLPWFCKGDAPPYSVLAGAGLIKLVSRQDNLIIEEIQFNRGNCRVEGAYTTDERQSQFPFTLRFGDNLLIEHECFEGIIEVTVIERLVEDASLGHVDWVPKN